MNRSILTLSLAVALTAATLSPNAQAVTVNRDYLSHGTANCQSALPVFDGNIRKRPAAVANEGTATAFVTCDSESINDGATGFSQAVMFTPERTYRSSIHKPLKRIYFVPDCDCDNIHDTVGTHF